MRLAEIEIGEHYAVKEYGMRRQVIAVEVGTFTNTVHDRYSFRGRKVQTKGLRAQTVNFKGEPQWVHRTQELTGEDLFTTKEKVTVSSEPSDEPATDWYRPQQVECKWADEVRGQQAKAARTASGQERAAELQAAFEGAGFKHVRVYFGRNFNSRYDGETLQISGLTSETTRLLEVLAAAKVEVGA